MSVSRSKAPLARGESRALVIEDSDASRLMISTLLNILGYSVDEAENGQAGLEKVRKARFDVVVTDIDMPVLDGFGFLAGLAELPGPRPAVVICSAIDPTDARLRLPHASGAVVVTKPFEPDDLANALVLASKTRQTGMC